MYSRLQRGGAAALAATSRRAIHWPIAGAVVLVGALTFASKLAVVFKEAIIASRFGAGDAVDAFFIALILPSFALNVIAGSIQSSFLPAYVETREKNGRAAADQLAASVLAGAGIALATVTVAFALFGRPLISLAAGDFAPAKLSLTMQLYYMLLPMLFVSGMASVWAVTLNAGQRFAVVAGAPIITPLIIAAALVFAGSALGIQAVAVGTLIGAGLEAVLIASWVGRQNLVVLPRWHGVSPAIRRVASQLAPMVGGAVLMSSSSFIDQSMAARLGTGSVSALNFGSRLVTGIVGIASVALGTAVFPHFAKLLATRERKSAVSILKTYVTLVIAVSAPIAFVIVVMSPSIVEVLFQRGSFTATDTVVVSRVQALYALQIPFFLIGMLGVRFISSLRGNQLLLWIGAANVVTNVLGNLFFMRIFGVAGIALSTSLVYVLSAAMIFLCIRYLIRQEFDR